MTLHVAVDRDVCISAGRCLATAPDVFDQDDEEGLALVVRQPTGDEEKLVRKAEYLCPAAAIHLSN
ncbi:ferredoxin [Actinokineospora sp. NBRC 105648]|uniref:ferredoxin n=1 Tax=Actinokineospora sp. NBRC 105648 TaxID=3032206 RepID=UPI0024A5EA86|nr:ferredoxin [Actinokineospora sp. NBRC 105648]GLZ40823.1 ferredoxin [Actinokineospora sp. NBRC 105648]